MRGEKIGNFTALLPREHHWSTMKVKIKRKEPVVISINKSKKVSK